MRARLIPATKVLDLKARLRCRGCGRKGRAWFRSSGRTSLPPVERKIPSHGLPVRRCGEMLDSAPSRRLAGLVSFGKRVCATTQRLSVSEISSGAFEALALAE